MASMDSQAGIQRAWRSPAAWVVFLTVVSVGLTLDLLTKSIAFENVAPVPVSPGASDLAIPNYEPIPLIPRLLNLHLVQNHGAVFGIGPNQRTFFVVFTVAALLAAVLVFARWTMRRAWFAHAAIGFILAGGLGNLYDRLRFAVVRDFLHMLPGWRLPFGLHWPGGSTEVFPWVFNAADVMLLTGMIMLMIHINRLERQRRAAHAGAPAEQPSQQPA
jgi:signal peptidase II